MEGALWLWGIGCLCVGGLALGGSLRAQREGTALVQSLKTMTGADADSDASRAPGAVEAELRVPSVGLSVPVLTGCTEGTLRRGACRMLGTAVAGGLGNMAVAGHRDTSFRPLERLRAGAVITVTDSTGTYDYVVNRTEIVSPDAVEVLNIGERPELTLITCYPFHYVGAAPQRFIAHAILRSVDGGRP